MEISCVWYFADAQKAAGHWQPALQLAAHQTVHQIKPNRHSGKGLQAAPGPYCRCGDFHSLWLLEDKAHSSVGLSTVPGSTSILQ